jgi:hypothetical protein
MGKFRFSDFWVKNTEILCKFSAIDPKPGSGAGYEIEKTCIRDIYHESATHQSTGSSRMCIKYLRYLEDLSYFVRHSRGVHNVGDEPDGGQNETRQ